MRVYTTLYKSLTIKKARFFSGASKYYIDSPDFLTDYSMSTFSEDYRTFFPTFSEAYRTVQSMEYYAKVGQYTKEEA